MVVESAGDRSPPIKTRRTPLPKTLQSESGEEKTFHDRLIVFDDQALPSKAGARQQGSG
jgi:hypothetical protein